MLKFTPFSDEIINKISDYLIWFAHDCGDVMTNLKLQKILYYAQGWFLALKNKPLFNNKIEAWIHGPVVPDVYHRFKEYKFNPISEEIKKPTVSHEVEEHLKEIMAVFGGCGAYELELMTHREEPWIKARKGLPIDAVCHNEITKQSMQDYFARIALENEQDKKS